MASVVLQVEKFGHSLPSGLFGGRNAKLSCTTANADIGTSLSLSFSLIPAYSACRRHYHTDLAHMQVHWNKMIHVHLTRAYQTVIGNSDQAQRTSDKLSAEVFEGLLLLKLLRTMELYDQGNYIASLISQRHFLAPVQFFAQRLGCVEVNYKGSVDRVMFPLPSSCLPGGPMHESSRIYDMMHTRWINREKKVPYTHSLPICHHCENISVNVPSFTFIHNVSSKQTSNTHSLVSGN